MIFKSLTGYEPYLHQTATYEVLESSKSIVLCALTSGGKSEAVFLGVFVIN
jgi:ATP-dependent helicase YprA (DUF1998 family)